MLTALPNGIFLGFALAVGVGPVNALCVRRSVIHGYSLGLWSGLGAALADAIFAIAVVLGMTWISEWLARYETPLRVGGAIFLFLWGIKIFFGRIDTKRPDRGIGTILGAFSSTFLLTIGNPLNLAAYSAVAAALGPAELATQPLSASLFVLGVFSGSMVWWTVLTAGAAGLTHRWRERAVPILNRAAGVVIGAVGLGLLLA
jgi:threonine/homoserine/homoserine lactone efflux protein